MIVCIIPARGGSKRIPNKNIREFCGKPMIAHSIEAAKAAGVFDRIVISTDSPEIVAVAKECGAEIPFMRPAALSDDYTTTDAVLIHALEQLGEVQSACCLYATAPFVQPEFLRAGYELLKKSGATSAFSVTSFPFPIQRGLKINDRGAVEMLWPEYRTTRSQDLPEVYHDAGQFYWFDARKYLKTPVMYAPDSVPVILPRYLVQDIDTPEDWARAELMFQALHKKS